MPQQHSEFASDSRPFELAIEAMNRGHSLSLDFKNSSLHEAIEAYSISIQIFDTIPNGRFHGNAHGAALMNRGQLKHRLNGAHQSMSAAADFERAATILRSSLNSADPWPRRNLVGTLINHTNLLLDLGKASEAMKKAEEALSIHHFAFQNDPTDSELAVLACRAFCDSAGQILPLLPADEQDQLAAHAHARVDFSLGCIRSLRPFVAVEPFKEASTRLFHFGALLLATYSPRDLEVFIESHLANLVDSSFKPALIESSRQAIRLAVESLSKDLISPETSFEQQDLLAHTSQVLGALYSSVDTI